MILVYTHRQTATRHYNREFRIIEGRRDTTSHGHIHIEPVYDQNVFCFLLSYCNIILIYVCMLFKVFLLSFIKLLQYHIVSSFLHQMINYLITDKITNQCKTLPWIDLIYFSWNNILLYRKICCKHTMKSEDIQSIIISQHTCYYP